MLGYPYQGLELKSFFNDEKRLGSYFFRFLPIFLGLFYLLFENSLKKYYFFLMLILIILIEILIIFSGERVAIFFIILFNLLTLVLIPYKNSLLSYFFVILALLLTSILIYNENLRKHVIDRTVMQFNYGNNFTIFSYEHEAHYLSAYRMFIHNPFLGVGPKMFREECSNEKYSVIITPTENSCSTHPHNFYMQLLAETGILFFLFFFLIFIYLNKIFINISLKKNSAKYKISSIFFLIAIYMSLWPIIPSGNIFNNWINIFYSFPIGFLININSKYIYKKFFE